MGAFTLFAFFLCVEGHNTIAASPYKFLALAFCFIKVIFCNVSFTQSGVWNKIAPFRFFTIFFFITTDQKRQKCRNQDYFFQGDKAFINT